MKKSLYFVALVFVFVSCKKENDPVSANPPEIQLKKIEYTDGSGPNYGFEFGYNSTGRISSYSYYQNSEPAIPLNSISYNGNEILITTSETTSSGTYNSETRIILDNQGRILKRIQQSVRNSPGAQVPQKQYFNDTLNYEYDAQGLLKKTSGGQFDSLWYNPNDLEIQSMHIQHTTNYTVSNGNFSNSVRIENITGTSLFNGVLHSFARSEEKTYTYDYTNQYPNKTDFSNTALLDEFSFAPFLIGKGYKNMPNKITYSNVKKDQNGNVTHTFNDVSNFALEFDSKGYLSVVIPNTAEPNYKRILFYE